MMNAKPAFSESSASAAGGHAHAQAQSSIQSQERAAPPLSAEARKQQALARLEASRTALILCLAPEAAEPEDAGGAHAAQGRSFADTLAARIQRNGLLQGSWRALSGAARHWWRQQPWRPLVTLVAQTVAHELRPLLRRHPLAGLAAATALGAGLVAVASAVRPWALQQVRRKASPWGERMGGLLWAQLSAAPVQMALAAALAAWMAEQGHRTARPSAAAASSESSAAAP